MKPTPSAQKILSQYYQLRDSTRAHHAYQDKLDLAASVVDGAMSMDMYPFRRIINTVNGSVSSAWPAHTRLINLGSNDYLGFTRRPEVIEAAQNALQQHGVGSGSVPMFAGTLSVHGRLEEELAAFLGFEDCLLFSSGYAANFGMLNALAGPDDAVIMDTLCHASIVDGSAGSRQVFFSHNDMDSLVRALNKAGDQCNRIIVTEGVFSMDGDLGHLNKIAEIAEEFQAILLVDDAHGIGVMGNQGRGTADHYGVTDKVDILTGSFGKALAGVGGFICGSRSLIRFIQLMCKPYQYSSSLPPSVLGGVLQEIAMLKDDDPALNKLWRNTTYLKRGFEELGFNTGQSCTPVIPLIFGDEIQVLRLSGEMESRGIFVNSIIYPVVSRRKSRMRISVTADLSQEDLDSVLNVFAEVC